MKRIVVIIDNCLQLEFKAEAEDAGNGIFMIQESDFRKDKHELISIMVMFDKQRVFARYKGFTAMMDIIKTEENDESTYICCKCNLFDAGIVIKPLKDLDSDLLDDYKFNGNPF